MTDAHAETLRAWFDRAAGHYDLLTGLDPAYGAQLRRSAERLLARGTDGSAPRILDLCCGTGRSTLALRRVYPDAELTALDASEGMLTRARAKRALRSVRFVRGDATDPAAAGLRGPFDAVFMAFGLRNVSDRDRCLGNVLGVLRPGGRFGLHEYVLDGERRSRIVWNLVCGGIIEPLGVLLTRDRALFRYLRASVLAFDTLPRLLERLRRAGFDHVHAETMGGWQRGIVHTVVAERPR
ncbi:MAG: class I SAM-dependent methyltransferase [Myxococcota bacterium]|nr:class I SAM-dependent methyltransferase [Myxococcota bacterium]MDW8362100.1 class I SAM-dependent methyltransferase [Myxococcales bacterium]